MPRPQFRLSTLLWITLAVACWYGGMRVERWWQASCDDDQSTPFVVDVDAVPSFKESELLIYWAELIKGGEP
jgi:hypothetical protein